MRPVTPPPDYVAVCYYRPDCPQFGKPMRVKPIETEYVEVVDGISLEEFARVSQIPRKLKKLGPEGIKEDDFS